MPQPEKRVPLEGTEIAPIAGSKKIGPANPHERAEVTVRVRPRASGKSMPTPEELGSILPKDRSYISREDYGVEHGAAPDDVEKVKSFAGTHGLNVESVDPAQRTIVLSGPVQALSHAFGVKMHHYSAPEGDYRAYSGAIHLPADLAIIVEDVSGLDNRPQARPIDQG